MVGGVFLLFLDLLILFLWRLNLIVTGLGVASSISRSKEPDGRWKVAKISQLREGQRSRHDQQFVIGQSVGEKVEVDGVEEWEIKEMTFNGFGPLIKAYITRFVQGEVEEKIKGHSLGHRGIRKAQRLFLSTLCQEITVQVLIVHSCRISNEMVNGGDAVIRHFFYKRIK